MKRINVNDTFYNVTKDDINLKDAFIDMGFQPMKNTQTYLTVGRVITIQKAIDHVKMSIESVNVFLKEKGLEVEVYE